MSLHANKRRSITYKSIFKENIQIIKKVLR